MPIDQVEFRFRLAMLALRIPGDVLSEIRRLHEAYGYECNAASEGQDCCLCWLAHPRQALGPLSVDS